MENDNFYRDPNDCPSRGKIEMEYFAKEDPVITLHDDGKSLNVGLSEFLNYLDKYPQVLEHIFDSEYELQKSREMDRRNSHVNPLFNSILDAISDNCGNIFSDADPGL